MQSVRNLARGEAAISQEQQAQDGCIICGHQRGSVLTEDPRRLLECGKCGFVYADSKPSPTEMASYYGSGSEEGTQRGTAEGVSWFTGLVARALKAKESLHRQRLALAGERVRRLVPVLRFAAGQTVLDVGCGRGEFLHALDLRYPGLSLAAIEPSPEDARYAREVYGLNVYETMLEEAGALPKADVVTMFHILEHVYDPAVALKKAGSLLATEGRLVVEVPNMRLSRINLPLGRKVLFPGYHSPEHLWFFTPRSLKALLTKQGFQMITMTTYTFGLYPLIDLAALTTNNSVWHSIYLSLARALTAPLSIVGAGLGVIAVARVGK
jgi:2-polyprenyl-3-methyl-5-hydroxy-6-metoxy-1,4-benzoquinol methylase